MPGPPKFGFEVAHRLVATVRDADVVARLGGDEFVIIHEAGPDRAATLLARLTETLSAPIAIGEGRWVRCPASIGLSDTITVGYLPARLLAAADAAMYSSKRARRTESPALVDAQLRHEQAS